MYVALCGGRSVFVRECMIVFARGRLSRMLRRRLPNACCVCYVIVHSVCHHVMNVFLLQERRHSRRRRHRRHRHMNLDISHKQKLNTMQLNHVLLFYFFSYLYEYCYYYTLRFGCLVVSDEVTKIINSTDDNQNIEIIMRFGIHQVFIKEIVCVQLFSVRSESN